MTNAIKISILFFWILPLSTLHIFVYNFFSMFLVGTILVAFLSPPSSLWLLFTFCFPSLGNEPFLPRAHLFALSTELNTITGGWLDQLWEPFIKVRKFEPIHRKGKVTFKAIIDETSFWESPSPHLKLFFPSIQLPQLHWSQI